MKTPSLLLALALALGLANPVAAQTFNQVATSADERLEAALSELADLRDQIADEKVPLSKEIAELESAVRAKQRELDELRRLQDRSDFRISELERNVKSLEEQRDYIGNILNEFITVFQGRLHVSENDRFLDTVIAGKNAPGNPNLSDIDTVSAQLDVVDLAMDRMESQVGGDVYAGEAVPVDGSDVLPGKFLSLGPSVYIAADNTTIAGFAEAQLNQDEPGIVAIGEESIPGIASAILNGSGTLPLDPTLGDALKIEQASKGIMDYVEDGGEVGIVIIALGVVSLLIALFKTFEVTSFPAPKPSELDAIISDLSEGNEQAASEKAAAAKGTSGAMLQEGVRHFQEKRGTLEELLFEKILQVRPRLERFLPFLAITAAAAPLLGLLGTVIGMIKTFELITIFGTGDAQRLSDGISEALVTTGLGLIVAIPVLVLHGLVSRMARGKINAMEQAAVAFVNGVSVLRDKRDHHA